MIFKVELRTDDPKLIEVLSEVRNKAKFVKKALRHYISTKRGKETFRIMTKHEPRDVGGEKDIRQPKRSVSPSLDKGKKAVYDFDSFLWTD